MSRLLAGFLGVLLLGGIGCESPPSAPLLPPIAEAGADQQLLAGQTVLLDGDGSRTVESGGQLAYAWVQVSGPVAVALQGADSVRATAVLGRGGVYAFRLTVTDAAGLSADDQVHVLVADPGGGAGPEPVNAAPRAEAGNDQQLLLGQTVLLDGSGSRDPEAEPLQYSWVQSSGEAVALRAADTARPMVTPTIAGEYAFRLTVIDPGGLSASDEVHLGVLPTSVQDPPTANQAPMADAGSDRVVRAGESVSVDGGGSRDPEAGSLAYAWVQLDGPRAVAIAGADRSTATVVLPEGGEYRFRLTVTDSSGLSASDEVRLTAAAAAGDGTVRLTVTSLGPEVARVEFRLAAVGADTLSGTLVITADGVATRTLLGVPSGPLRLVEVFGYDRRDRLVGFASELVEILANRVNAVELQVKSVPIPEGRIEVEAVFEDEAG
ncbi:MAG: PKD domain-containing protein [Candidatus Latescibacterota bacterium]|jgi:hypothetical protein